MTTHSTTFFIQQTLQLLSMNRSQTLSDMSHLNFIILKGMI